MVVVCRELHEDFEGFLDGVGWVRWEEFLDVLIV